jgi:hypothetical protein
LQEAWHQGHNLACRFGDNTAADQERGRYRVAKAAMLFYVCMLNEGRMLLANNAQVVTSVKIDSVFRRLPWKFIDPVQALDMNEKWIKTSDDLF